MFRTDLPDDLLAPKKTGRKITWKDIKTVFVKDTLIKSSQKQKSMV